MSKTINITWHIQDVLYQAKQGGQVITEAEAEEILSNVERDHDATIGINWDVIDCHIDMYLYEKSKQEVNQ